MSTILNFITSNVYNSKFFPEGYDSYDEFVEHQTNCVNELRKNMIEFYTELIFRIGNSEMDFYDMEWPTESRSPIKYFYFSKLNSNKLVLVGGAQIHEQPDKTNNDFYKKLANICENNQIVVKSSPDGQEWDSLSHYGRNHSTGNFDVAVPR